LFVLAAHLKYLSQRGASGRLALIESNPSGPRATTKEDEGEKEEAVVDGTWTVEETSKLRRQARYKGHRQVHVRCI
jgi:hypothetical protein